MLFVFLHGKGSDKDAYSKQLKALANSISADFTSFNAPFFSSTKAGKFLWFNKDESSERRDAIKSEYLFALDYIKAKLNDLNHPFSDIVLIGHSQGGGMAVAVALEMNLKAAISICGDLPYNLEYQNKSQTPIYWLEGKQDTYLNQDRKNSYKIFPFGKCEIKSQGI